ncbi:DUF4870 domain-containing protein [Desertihabitans brevis]|uniref:DUF4870 domain-containing protein n=1 Tax=Desertihabitans brevis TaxID=2268447 RepID=A0A367YUN6_9ACTN|nr:DUF4870 domain-containing protein [Desertihabitans brevis]RCK69596.1 DUF4870 domain-containing protein [Desertihabitans brevis]
MTEPRFPQDRQPESPDSVEQSWELGPDADPARTQDADPQQDEAGPVQGGDYAGPSYSTPSYHQPGGPGDQPAPASADQGSYGTSAETGAGSAPQPTQPLPSAEQLDDPDAADAPSDAGQESGASGGAPYPTGQYQAGTGGDATFGSGSVPSAPEHQPADPYAAPSEASRPYAQQGQPAADPYAQQGPYSQPSANQYGQQGGYSQPSADPYAQQGPYSQPSANQYGQQGGYSQPSADPYAQPGPYSQPSANQYGQGGYSQPGADPYGQPGGYSQPGADPYAQQGPYSQPSADPYAQQGGGYSQPSANQYAQPGGYGQSGQDPYGYPGQPGSMAQGGPGAPGQPGWSQGAPAGPPVSQSDEKTWGTLAHVGMLVGGFLSTGFLAFVVPLILFLVYKDRSPWLRYNAVQALNFGILAAIVSVVSVILSTVLIGFLTWLAIGVLGLIFGIQAAMKANNGEFYKYPLNVSFVK